MTSLVFQRACRSFGRRRSFAQSSSGDKQRQTLVLGIETSFDETGAAVVDVERRTVVGASLASTYARKFSHMYGGVVPGLAAAEQVCASVDVFVVPLVLSSLVQLVA